MSTRKPAELEDVTHRVLDNFYPFISAWESRDPYSGADGEELYEELKRTWEARTGQKFVRSE